jgi:hypothetical protein
MLADLGANVVILDKDEPNARANAQAIEKKTGKAADVIVADLSVQSQVRQAANDILAKYPKIDVLINNAGIFTELYSEVDNGVERTLANNHLGGFMLTQLLMTRLQESKARVVFVSSDAHRQAMKVNWDDINGKALWKGKDRNPNAGFAQYNLSKLFVASAAIELAERTKGTGVTINTIAPGALIPTGIYDDATGPLPLIIKYFRPLLRQPEKAMITYIYLATSPEVANASGWYWKDGRFLDASQLASSQEVRDQVWEWSMRQTGLSAAVKS